MQGGSGNRRINTPRVPHITLSLRGICSSLRAETTCKECVLSPSSNTPFHQIYGCPVTQCPWPRAHLPIAREVNHVPALVDEKVVD